MEKIMMENMLKKVFANADAEKIAIFGYDVYMKISNEVILISCLKPKFEEADGRYIPYKWLNLKVINKITGVKIDETTILLTDEDCGFELLEDCNGLVFWSSTASYPDPSRGKDWIYDFIQKKVNEYIELFK